MTAPDVLLRILNNCVSTTLSNCLISLVLSVVNNLIRGLKSMKVWLSCGWHMPRQKHKNNFPQALEIDFGPCNWFQLLKSLRMCGSPAINLSEEVTKGKVTLTVYISTAKPYFS